MQRPDSSMTTTRAGSQDNFPGGRCSSAAILIRAAVLVGLASRILYQDRELAAIRAAGQRRIAVDQLRRELDAHLEAIKLQEINRLIRSLDSDNPVVIFTGSKYLVKEYLLSSYLP
jgi:hypothetical protein